MLKKRLLRTFHTLRHLRPRQAFYYVWRRGIGARRTTPWQGPIAARPEPIAPALQFAHGGTASGDFRFRFLNHALEFPRAAMNWNPAAANRLWRYNLHYFDFLADPARPLEEKCALLDDWILRNPPGSEPAWEPYTASLRIVNWCRFLGSLPAAQRQPQWLRSLYDQALWLEKNLELHILANHLFENIKALLFAAATFDDRSSARWLAQGQRLLADQLREQTLADGGHYERSPQYHCILLDDYLDLLALARSRPALFETALEQLLARTIHAALGLLAHIATPDDDIPLFNDSASNAAPRPGVLFARARALGFEIALPAEMPIDCPDTGLYGWKDRRDYFLIDCGDIGPAYQPGHTHCDFLSYVLMVDGQWLVVDSGVCEYEPGPLRTYVRSTAAHNTILVDDQEQSEVWGEFRVARRARKRAAAIEGDRHGGVFEGSYRGFPGIAGGIVHWRRATWKSNAGEDRRELTIEDAIDGHGRHTVQSLVHLHPAIDVQLEDGRAVLRRDGAWVATLAVEPGCTLAVGSGWYCPEFGIRLPNPVLSIQRCGTLPLTIGYRLESRPEAPPGR